MCRDMIAASLAPTARPASTYSFSLIERDLPARDPAEADPASHTKLDGYRASP